VGDVVVDGASGVFYCAVSIGAVSATAPHTDIYNGVTGHWVAAMTNAWKATVAYYVGDRVSVGGVAYTAVTPNFNVTPAVTHGNWTSGVAYVAGETVLANGASGVTQNVVFKCLQNHNASSTNRPAVATPWAVGTTYALNDVISYGGITFKSLQNGNVGNTPDASGSVPYTSAFWLQIASVSAAFWTPIWQTQTAQSPGIVFYGGGAVNRFYIRKNNIKSTDYTPIASKGSATWLGVSGGNVGIHLHGQKGQTWEVSHNVIENFYAGIYVGTSFPSGRNVYTQGLHYNRIADCSYGFWWAGSVLVAGDCQFAIGNILSGVTDHSFNGYNGNGLYFVSGLTAAGSNVEVIKTNGLTDPNNGTWVIGDRYISSGPTAGGFIGKVCTTGGVPGVAVWKTYGAISP
jgi:hypothetical protein